MKRLLAGGLTVAAVLLGGCAHFTYDDVQFSAAQDALDYQDKQLREGVQAVTPSSSAIRGILKIYVPSDDVTRERFVSGSKNGVVADYIVTAYAADKHKLKEAFERRGSFEAVELIFSDGMHQPPAPGQHVLYLYLESPLLIGWYYVGTAVARTPVIFRQNASSMGERYKLFIESVETLAMKENAAAKR